MKVLITIRDVEGEDGIQATSDFPAVSFTGSDRGLVIDAVKGSIYHALGDWPKPPSFLEFEVIDNRPIVVKSDPIESEPPSPGTGL